MPPSTALGSLSEGVKTLEVGVERIVFGLGFLGMTSLLLAYANNNINCYRLQENMGIRFLTGSTPLEKLLEECKISFTKDMMAKMTSPSNMMDSLTDSMKERTGKTLEEWVLAVQASGIDPLDQKAVRNWLKTKHSVLQNSQWAIADAAARAGGWVRPSVEGYIDSQYQGEKAALRPIFDSLREIIEGMGEDVSAEGRGGYTPFLRKRQFAAVQASTRTHIDLGLRFKEAPQSELLSTKSLPGQSTHKISLTSLEEITDEVRDLIHLAYEQNG